MVTATDDRTADVIAAARQFAHYARALRSHERAGARPEAFARSASLKERASIELVAAVVRLEAWERKVKEQGER